jgi:type II secretory pathway component PulF
LAFVIPTDNGTFLWFDEPTELPTITFNLRHLSHLTEKNSVFFSNAVIFFFVFFRKKTKKTKAKQL